MYIKKIIGKNKNPSFTREKPTFHDIEVAVDQAIVDRNARYTIQLPVDEELDYRGHIVAACFNTRTRNMDPQKAAAYLTLEESATCMKAILKYQAEYISHVIAGIIYGPNAKGVYDGINPDTQKPYPARGLTPAEAWSSYLGGVDSKSEQYKVDGGEYTKMLEMRKKLGLNKESENATSPKVNKELRKFALSFAKQEKSTALQQMDKELRKVALDFAKEKYPQFTDKIRTR